MNIITTYEGGKEEEEQGASRRTGGVWRGEHSIDFTP